MKNQKDMIAELAALAHTADALIVSEIASQSVWLAATGDDERHLYLSGPMGMATSVGLGVALANLKRPVLVITGDGSLMMNLPSLVTINHMVPPNLTIALMDNEIYDFTGKGPTPSNGLNWVEMMKGYTNITSQSIDGAGGLTLSANSGPAFWHAKVAPMDEKGPALPLTGPEIHKRFKNLVG